MTDNTGIPRYYAARTSLRDIAGLFQGLMINYLTVDISETLRVMLADYFYGDTITTPSKSISMMDRTLVFNIGLEPTAADQMEMMEVLGDIFWHLEETIRRNVLMVQEDLNSAHEYRPHECFYTFDTNTYDLMVYMPEREGCTIPGIAALDGRAVLAATRTTWPKFLTDRLPQADSSIVRLGKDY